MRVLIILLYYVVGIVLHRLPLVHGVEAEAGVVGLDGLEEKSESIVKTTPIQRSTVQMMQCVERTTRGRSAVVGIPFRDFHFPRELLCVYKCGRQVGRAAG